MQLANNLVLFLKGDAILVVDLLYALYQDKKVTRHTQLYIATENIDSEAFGMDSSNGSIKQMMSIVTSHLEMYSAAEIDFKKQCKQLLINSEYIHLANSMDAESQSIAKQAVFELVSTLTSSFASPLHVVQVTHCPIVNYYFSYFLSLYGRQQDCLFHIDAFATNSEPVRHKIALLNIPLIKSQISLEELNQQSPHKTDNPITLSQNMQLRIDVTNKKTWINDTEVKLTPILFSWYSWLALRRKYLAPQNAAIDLRGNHHIDFLKHFIKLYGDDHHNYVKIEEAINRDEGFTINYMSEKRSRINKAIKQTFAPNVQACLIQSDGKRPYTSHGLNIQPEYITFTPSAQ